MSAERIERIDCMSLALPLERPLWASGLRIARREFFVVRVETASGCVGFGFHKSRGLILDRIVTDNLAPVVTGMNPLEVERIWSAMHQGTLLAGRTGAVMRAIGALDIAIWDIRAQLAGLPLHQLLGGYRETCPILLVTGYYEENPLDLGPMIKDMNAHLADGFEQFKIAGGMLGDEDEFERIRTARQTLGQGPGLVVDVNWVWHDLKRALRNARRWEQFDIGWIEEPFPPGSTHMRKRFADESPVPLGIGDEQCGVAFFRDLMASQSADVIRVDTPVLGGITPTLRVIAMASAYGLPVSPHIYPEINVHLAAAFGNVTAVEAFSRRSALYQIDRFITPPLEYAGGQAVAPAAPGLGFTMDWDAMRNFAV
ncbi:MAG: mandelate racemase/muconate lactonizing enzyme family protein [Gammaproteobacteria bacterium]|nr:mandelate racemase/muconate lactonizing enzyme family protein [Gammaproteobacteria bacterium]NNM00488.1 mandelate racemase/muconate lactonizing enzyme family protein [Gammaproteobacteria bacterium]